MIGILCNQNNESSFTKTLNDLIRTSTKKFDTSIMLFSMPNINLITKTVYGSVINGKKVRAEKREIPTLIFNFSIQRSRKDIKKMRSLIEIEEITVINAVNRYNQLTIIEMLSSNNKTNNYLLPYFNYKKNDIYCNFPQTNNFLLKPDKGSDLSKTVYLRLDEYIFDIYSRFGKQRCHNCDVESNIQPIIKNENLILLNTPELKTRNTQLVVIRVYLQKLFNNDWEIILKDDPASYDLGNEACIKKIKAAAPQIIKCVQSFIPDIGFCHIDFISDIDGVPYFMNFGGWDNKIFSSKVSLDVKLKIFENLMEFAEGFKNLQKAGGEDVG
ncbi:MAG: hypothetical protein Q8942_13930 [Bacillota bacterium]|nr:hypothetical protein [Bacillota bacterium]